MNLFTILSIIFKIFSFFLFHPASVTLHIIPFISLTVSLALPPPELHNGHLYYAFNSIFKSPLKKYSVVF